MRVASRILLIGVAACAALFGSGPRLRASAQDTPEALFRRADASLFAGHFTEAVAGFDALVRQDADYGPQLWQRGIALYYAGRFDACRAQFESHRRVNPDDVENAAWHFLCVARASSPQRARAVLLPVGPDRRVPMREVYGMFEGTVRPEQVMSAATAAATPSALFYAHLYVGLYLEANGDKAGSLAHIGAAAATENAPVGGYMHRVAQLHLSVRQGR